MGDPVPDLLENQEIAFLNVSVVINIGGSIGSLLFQPRAYR
jgi:hypothetical protein